MTSPREMETKLRGTNALIICRLCDSREAEEGAWSPLVEPWRERTSRGTTKEGRPPACSTPSRTVPSSGTSGQPGALWGWGNVPTFPRLATHVEPALPVASPSRTPCGRGGLLSSVGGRSRPPAL